MKGIQAEFIAAFDRSGLPVLGNTFPGDLNIAASALKVTEDGADFPLSHLKQTAAGCFAHTLEIGAESVFVQRPTICDIFCAGLAVY